ncbi:PepSY domain-containing protein [Sphingomonas koreensis]|nr:PepSY domain-containing protein [Sphingomonas koreensis]
MTKLQMRRAWFQVHKWIGLALAILIIPLSLSGALLVWDQPLDRLLNPARYAVSGAQLLPAQAYVAAAGRALPPGARIAMLNFPDGAGPVIVQASPAGGGKRQAGPPARTSVYLDPPNARVLAIANSRSGALRVIHMLHGSLLVPGVGRSVVGWIGVAMMLSCFTGLWLWWPTVGAWARGLRWKRHRNFDTNLHHLMGFWIALPLFVLSLTGAWIAFPGFFGALTGQASAQRGPDRGARMRAQPLAAPHLTIDQAIAAAGSRARTVAWPTDTSPSWTVTLDDPPREATVSDADATVTIAPARTHGGAGIAGLMRRLHDGDGMGPVWQTIIFIGGVLPAALAITGIIMWWRARNWRAALAARMRADRVAAE